MSLMAGGLLMVYAALVVWTNLLLPGPAPVWQWIWCAVTLGGQCVLTLIVRSGRTLHMPDPALTGSHVAWALSCVIASTLLSPEAQDMLPYVTPLCLLLGSPGLRKSQLIGLTIYAFVLSGLSLALAPQMLQRHATTNDVVHLVILSVALLSSLCVGLRLYAVRMQLLVQRQILMQELEEHRNLASRDALTGLVNRRSMLELLHLEQRRCLRGSRTMAVAILDLDHFKRINDTYGHAVGDQALQHFADIVRVQVRSGDILARWGGEEFVLMLCDIDNAGAQALLERVSHAVATTPMQLPSGPAIALTVSAGFAVHEPGESVEATLERADMALYQAKEQGRNRVCWGGLCTVTSPADETAPPPEGQPALAPVGFAPPAPSSTAVH